jgi:hypothetical protein
MPRMNPFAWLRRPRHQEELREVWCSFCRKSNKDVGKLVEGPNKVFICEDCAELCRSIFEQVKQRAEL